MDVRQSLKSVGIRLRRSHLPNGSFYHRSLGVRQARQRVTNARSSDARHGDLVAARRIVLRRANARAPPRSDSRVAVLKTDAGAEPAVPRYNCTPRVSAPSITRLVPVVKPDAGLARKTMLRPTSSGVAIRPVGFSDSACL
jgi:hypothetical protein